MSKNDFTKLFTEMKKMQEQLNRIQENNDVQSRSGDVRSRSGGVQSGGVQSGGVPCEIESSSVETVLNNEMMQIGTCEHVHILTRVSTQKQTENDSLETQKSHCLNVMRRLGCKKYTSIKYIIGSAYNTTDELESYYESIRNLRHNPVIIVLYPNRLTRRTTKGTELLRIVQQKQGRIIYCKSDYSSNPEWTDTNIDTATFILNIAAGEDNSKTQGMMVKQRKRKIKEEASVMTIERECELTLKRNSKDTEILRNIITFFKLCKEGGSVTLIFEELKNLIQWTKWPKFESWKKIPFVIAEEPLKKRVAKGELTYSYIVSQLINWKIDFPIKINNKKIQWSEELVEILTYMELDDETLTTNFKKL
jgi:DNA invertase Pin-like site-specific DNA recombinase